MSHIDLKGEPVGLRKRGISSETCRKFRCLRDGELLRFYYTDRSGSLTGAKCKTVDKQFHFEGSNPDKQFYGQWAWPSRGKRVVITEGELDMLSCVEAMPNWPMVSLPNGAASAKKSIQNQLEWLQGYEEIVLFFDNDDAGRQAAEGAASVLPPGRAKVAHLHDYKDASDALQDGHADLIRRAIWDAQPYVPGGIISATDLFTTITSGGPSAFHDYPWDGLQKLMLGIREGELVTFTAGSGIGKSSICRQLAVDLLQSGVKVGYLALEESVRRTALGLMGTALGQPFHLGGFSDEELREAYNQTVRNWNLYLFDGFGSFDPDVIYNRIEYLAAGLDVKVVFLDHLSILLSGLEGDERRTIDITMTRLRSLVERTGITLFLVSHLTGSKDKPHEEGGRVTLSQLRGSRSIGQLSDAVVALERNQQSDEDSGTTVRVLKNRFAGFTGVACCLYWDNDKQCYTEEEVELPFTDENSDY